MGSAASVDIPDELRNYVFTKNEIDPYLQAFFNFEEHADSNAKISFDKLISLFETKYDVFLTHDWGLPETGHANHLKVIDICERLEKKYDIKCWLDHARMENNVHETMIEGIDDSNAVVVFITPRYIEKVAGTHAGDNCKLEFGYAARKKTATKMLGVVMDSAIRDPQDWKGSVGFILGGDIYVDCVADEEPAISSSVEELYSRIVSKLGGVTIRSALEKMARDIVGDGPVRDAEPINNKQSVAKTAAGSAPATSVSSSEAIAFNKFRSWFIEDLGFASTIAEKYVHLFADNNITSADRLKRVLKRNKDMLAKLDIDPMDGEDIVEILLGPEIPVETKKSGDKVILKDELRNGISKEVSCKGGELTVPPILKTAVSRNVHNDDSKDYGIAFDIESTSDQDLVIKAFWLIMGQNASGEFRVYTAIGGFKKAGSDVKHWTRHCGPDSISFSYQSDLRLKLNPNLEVKAKSTLGVYVHCTYKSWAPLTCGVIYRWTSDNKVLSPVAAIDNNFRVAATGVAHSNSKLVFKDFQRIDPMGSLPIMLEYKSMQPGYQPTSFLHNNTNMPEVGFQVTNQGSVKGIGFLIEAKNPYSIEVTALRGMQIEDWYPAACGTVRAWVYTRMSPEDHTDAQYTRKNTGAPIGPTFQHKWKEVSTTPLEDGEWLGFNPPLRVEAGTICGLMIVTKKPNICYSNQDVSDGDSHGETEHLRLPVGCWSTDRDDPFAELPPEPKKYYFFSTWHFHGSIRYNVIG